MPRRNHRYHQEHYHEPSGIDWTDIIPGLIVFGAVVVFIISCFIFDTNRKAELANAEATKNYEKILSVAAKNCSSEVVKLLVRENLVNIYENRDFGERLLEYTVEKECLEVIQFLVEKKVDINSTRALQYAAEQGNLEVVKFLLQKGANPNIKGSYGKTPRDFAVTMSWRNENSNKPYREIIDLFAKAEKSYKSEK